MTFCIFDPALINNAGHHPEHCRLIVNELRQRNCEFRLFSNISVSRELIEELNATPCFECCTYHSYFQYVDPIAGWLTDFDVNSASMLRDLEKLGEFKKDDTLYFNSIRPAQFDAVIHWMRNSLNSEFPRVFAEFGTEPGVDLEHSETGLPIVKSRDPRRDPRSVLYRYSASRLTPEIAAHLTLFTFERSVSEIYSYLTQQKVATFPWPHSSKLDSRVRELRPKLTIAFLGHQRYEKGFQLVPSLVRGLSQFTNLEFLIHNSAPYEMHDIQRELHDLCKVTPQIRLNETQADGVNWQDLLDQPDVVVCPYDPIRYASSHSGLLVECIANGIPVVVPARTVLASTASEYNGMATEFEQWTPESIGEAIVRAVDRIDDLGARAHQASRDWALGNGVSKLVDCFLATN